MILADTSVWADYFRGGNDHLSALLVRNLISMHAWIVGELACGTLPRRAKVIKDLQRLPAIPVARDHEVLFLIERHHLMGSGIGWVDAQLLTAALASGVSVWTRDKQLASAAGKLGALYSPPVP